MSDIDLSIFLSIVIGIDGYDVGGFGELVHDHSNRVKLAVVSGKPTRKSILMSSHFHLGMLSGCNNPTCFM
jgi:hypothetical protein